MISPKSVDAVKDLLIEDVIGKYVTLKKKGASFEACCPFHDEKTPSFKVDPSKGIYKCFGCGKGGNGGIAFVMENESLSFPEAITEIGQKFNIFIEKDDSDDAREYVKIQQTKESLAEINSFALSVFRENFKTIEKKFKRTTPEMAELFSLGYSNDDYKDLYKKALNNGTGEKDMLQLGLITKTAKGVFDYYNERTIFPIFDHYNKLIGFGARNENYKKGDKFPKYLNSKENTLFHKRSALYGIHLAKKAIIKSGVANVVEGYYDVIAMHQEHIINTVASSGTAFTIEQAQLLKKWCKTIRLIFDNDNAGKKAAEKAIMLLSPLGFITEIVFFPEGDDPDSYDGDLNDYLNENIQDGIEWIAAKFFEKSDTTVEITIAENKLENLLSQINNVKLRNRYIKILAKKYSIERKEIEKNVKSIIVEKQRELSDEGFIKLPNGVDREEYEKFGFYEIEKKGNKRTGYYFVNQSSNFEQRSNFIIKPLFHIYSKTDNKRLIEIINARTSKIIDVPSKGFVGQNQFFEEVIAEGNFWFHGSKPNFQKVMVKILEKFPRCEEIKTLGWQDEGFYSFANGIVDAKFKKVDHYGIVEFSDKQYFLPAFSNVYKDVRREDDLYENERHFVFRKSDITFEKWSNQFVRVHGDNGKIAIAYLIASLFRDEIYKTHKVFPHLFMFGSISTGKSYCARSLNSIFHGGEPGFNLTTGTLVGMNRKLAQFRNALIWFDEYGNDMEKLRFDRLKGAYDGLGHEKGVMSHDNRTKKTDINSAAVISGQFLPSRDDNSLFTRVLLLTFDRKAEDLTNDDIKAGSLLKKWENEGLSSLIVEILKYRDLIIKDFNDVNFQIQSDLKKAFEDEEYQGRIMMNFSLILTPIKIIIDKLKIPFDYDDIFKQSIKMILHQSEQVHDSDSLRTFWKMLEYLHATGQITADLDFKIQDINGLSIRINRNKNQQVDFKQQTKCLFIRFTKIHPLYMVEHRKQTGENGIGDGSLKQYMKTNKAFIGFTAATTFDNGKTSAFVFDYDKLGIELEMMKKVVGPTAVPPKRENEPTVQELEFGK